VLTGHHSGVYCLDLTPDGKHVVSGDRAGTIRIWNIESLTCEATLWGQRGDIVGLAISSDGRIAATKSHKQLGVWDLVTKTCKGIVNLSDRSVYAVALTPDGTTVVAGLDDGTIRSWDSQTLRQLGVIQAHQGDWVSCLALIADGKQIVSTCGDGSISVSSLLDCSCIAVLRKSRGWSPQGPLAFHVTVSEDGHFALSTSNESVVRVWDLQNFREMGQLRGHTATICS
jgi:WD40 repeat protein